MIKVQYFGEKSLESSMKSVSKGGAVAPTSSAVDPPMQSLYFSVYDRLRPRLFDQDRIDRANFNNKLNIHNADKSSVHQIY